MLNQNRHAKRIHDAIERDTEIAKRVIYAPIVQDDEEARLVGSGLKALQTMSSDEFKKLEKLTIKEIAEGWAGEGETAIKAAAAAVSDAMQLATASVMGQSFRNRLVEARKGMDHLRDDAAATRTVSMDMSGPEAPGLDLGWRRAFVFEDATGVELLKIMNWRAGLRYLEYNNSSDEIQLETVGGSDSQREGARYFAAGFKVNEREARFSTVTVNQMLSYARQEYLFALSRLAYREIFTKKYGGTDVVADTFNSSSPEALAFALNGDNDKENWDLTIYQARSILNAAHRHMVDSASQIENGKSRKRSKENPIRVTATDPILLYHNHRHNEAIEAIYRNGRGDNDINPTLIANVVPISTAIAPISGGWDVTATTEKRDDFGFFGTTKETANPETIGGMLVIPGNYNIMATFRNLSFVNATDMLRESTTIGAKFEARPLMDKRQKALVNLGTYL